MSAPPESGVCIVSVDDLLSPEDQTALLRELMRKRGHLEITVTGSCMRPWIGSGDLVEVRAISGRPVRGMIVLVELGGNLATHRIVRIGPGQNVTTRGDLMERPDSPVSPAALLGEVVAVQGVPLPLDSRWLQRAGLMAAPVLRIVRLMRRELRKHLGN